jgi:hypothetical protein
MGRLVQRIAARIPPNERLVRIACVLALVALPLMVWSLFDPTVWPVLVALSVGQGLGTLSFALYLIAVVRDLGIGRRLGEARPLTDDAPQRPPGDAS